VTTLHQLRCFVASYEHGSLTAAARALGYSQPSVSEQVRLLEQGMGVRLFRRVGRGLVPTEAAHALRPHADQALAAVAHARTAATAVAELESGTIRFGVFGTSRLYLGSELALDVLERHPGVRVELVGQNSSEVQTELRSGRMEAAVIAIPVADAGLEVHPVMRDELVYVSADPARCAQPVTPAALAAAPLVLSEASWGNVDSTRAQLQRAVQGVGGALRPRVEVEDVETALEVAASGLADCVTARGVLHRLADRLPPALGWVALRPRLFDEFAVVHRRGTTLSPAATLMVELATSRLRALAVQLRSQPRRRVPDGGGVSGAGPTSP
jgi:DNA-binding transcriptional LysR family regulator